MVQSQLESRDIVDPRVLTAMRRVPRHVFVPEELQAEAYDDRPLPIGSEQTISQPYVVALMIQLVHPQPGDVVLDIGTGCGYQAAILGELCREVYSLEIVKPLAERAGALLARLGYRNVHVRCGDASDGWPEQAPFDVIIGAAAPRHMPEALFEQLATGGRLILPIGSPGRQELVLFERRSSERIERIDCGAVSFVPMTGGASGS